MPFRSRAKDRLHARLEGGAPAPRFPLCIWSAGQIFVFKTNDTVEAGHVRKEDSRTEETDATTGSAGDETSKN